MTCPKSHSYVRRGAVEQNRSIGFLILHSQTLAIPGPWSVDPRPDASVTDLVGEKSEQSTPHAQELLQSTHALTTELVEIPVDHHQLSGVGWRVLPPRGWAGGGQESQEEGLWKEQDQGRDDPEGTEEPNTRRLRKEETREKEGRSRGES